MKNIAGHIT